MRRAYALAGSTPAVCTKPNTQFKTMSILSAFKHIIPEFHAYSDDEKRYNIGATWTDQDGLRDHHNLELRYVRNSERLALQGEPQPDGSWRYVEANGSVHVISPERAKHFMEQTQAHATIMCGMLEKLKDAGVLDQMLDTTAEPA
jgi:hypothetical protein